MLFNKILNPCFAFPENSAYSHDRVGYEADLTVPWKGWSGVFLESGNVVWSKAVKLRSQVSQIQAWALVPIHSVTFSLSSV